MLIVSNTHFTARAIAQRVRNGTQSADTDVVRALTELRQHDDRIHAFLHLFPEEELRSRAATIDDLVARGIDPGPLAGVPIAIKDNICVCGAPTTCGSKILQGWHPPYEATVVEKLRGAGAILLGKTNMDEFGMGSSTENSAYGPTRNPHDLSRVPGGSSGGSAAAVAAAFAPVAIGSDTGGSIRLPAAYCGVVGLKPTYGAVSRYGLVAYASSLEQIGPLATTIADTALLFDVIAGPDERDSTTARHQRAPTLPQLEAGVDHLKVGLVTQLLPGDIDKHVRSAVYRAADCLSAAGADIVEVSIPSAARALAVYYIIATSEASSNLARFDGVRYGLRIEGSTTREMMIATRTAGFGAEVKRRIMLGTFALSAGYREAYYDRAKLTASILRDEFVSAFTYADILLSPVAPTAAFPFGENQARPLDMYLNDVFTILANLTGFPALAIPSGTHPSGMPLSVQLMGPYMSEHLLLKTGMVLEAAWKPTSPQSCQQ